MCACVWKGWEENEKEGIIKRGEERLWEDTGGGKSGKVETGMAGGRGMNWYVKVNPQKEIWERFKKVTWEEWRVSKRRHGGWERLYLLKWSQVHDRKWNGFFFWELRKECWSSWIQKHVATREWLSHLRGSGYRRQFALLFVLDHIQCWWQAKVVCALDLVFYVLFGYEDLGAGELMVVTESAFNNANHCWSQNGHSKPGNNGCKLDKTKSRLIFKRRGVSYWKHVCLVPPRHPPRKPECEWGHVF